MDMLAYFKDSEPDILKELEDEKVLTDELKERILEAAKSIYKEGGVIGKYQRNPK